MPVGATMEQLFKKRSQKKLSQHGVLSLVLWFLVLGETAKLASGTDTHLDRKTSIASIFYICKENVFLNVTFLQSVYVLDPLH